MIIKLLYAMVQLWYVLEAIFLENEIIQNDFKKDGHRPSNGMNLRYNFKFMLFYYISFFWIEFHIFSDCSIG